MQDNLPALIAKSTKYIDRIARRIVQVFACYLLAPPPMWAIDNFGMTGDEPLRRAKRITQQSPLSNLVRLMPLPQRQLQLP